MCPRPAALWRSLCIWGASVKTIPKENFSCGRGVKYPIVITEDTTFHGCSFAQMEPHTDGIFDIKPGVRVCFGIPEPKDQQEANESHCNLMNVKVPDGVEVYGGNLAQVHRTETGNPERPVINLLCDCDKCAPVRPVIQEILSTEDPEICRDKWGRWIHDHPGHDNHVKAAVRERRKSPELVAEHAGQIAFENAEALSKWEK
jgi:hypothetical protein